MAKRVDDAEYDRLIYDQAKDIAVECGRDPKLMVQKLLLVGAKAESIGAVIIAQLDDRYSPSFYRGGMCDAAVIEAIKDALRPIYGF